MATLKTQPNEASVKEFLEKLESEEKKVDSYKLLEIFRQESGEEPLMWGGSIIGYGTYHYVYSSGREGDWMLTGFSPRKNQFSLYIMAGFEHYSELMEKLGKYKTGKSCLYIRKLSDVDESVLRQLIRESVTYMREKYA